MSVKLVLINMRCDICPYQNKKIDISQSPFHLSYQLVGFCYKHNAWITLLKDKEWPIMTCEE